MCTEYSNSQEIQHDLPPTQWKQLQGEDGSGVIYAFPLEAILYILSK